MEIICLNLASKCPTSKSDVPENTHVGSPPESVLFAPSVSGLNADKQFIFLWLSDQGELLPTLKPVSCAVTPECVWSLFLCLFTEGVLTLRAKPPSEAEFIDSLQKLKLALNLLVRYRSSKPPSHISPHHLSHCVSVAAPPAGQTQEPHTESKCIWADTFPLWPTGVGKCNANVITQHFPLLIYKFTSCKRRSLSVKTPPPPPTPRWPTGPSNRNILSLFQCAECHY